MEKEIHFNNSFSRLMKSEGGYVNDPQDPGGETYKGISRKNHPEWDGWGVIDELKENRLFPDLLELDNHLQHDVEDFYYINYWKPSKANEICLYDPEIAFQLFDFSVNVGIIQAQVLFQSVTNILQIIKSEWISIDGVIGPKTIRAFKIVLPRNCFLDYYKSMRISHYFSIIHNNPDLSKFAFGWCKRVFE